MGRNIPSVSCRIESRLAEWERFAKLLNREERAAFSKLVSAVKDRRTAIDTADEDIGLAMLLAMIVTIKGELDERRGPDPGQRPAGKPLSP